MRFTISRNSFNVLEYDTTCFELSRIDKRVHGSSYRGYDYIENDLKGNENCLESAGGATLSCVSSGGSLRSYILGDLGGMMRCFWAKVYFKS